MPTLIILRKKLKRCGIRREKAKESLLVLVGPTASGKTQVALEILKKIPAEIISCDSMQVYRGMPITTQATSPLTHLVSFLEPSKEYSAALFREDAEALIETILKKKKIPLIVGGTGLYLRALLDGLFQSDLNSDGKNEALRNSLMDEEQLSGKGTLHQKLQKIDPASAKKIHPHDTRRLIRALEVCILTKKTFSSQLPNRKGIRDKFNVCVFFLDRDRKDLYERINQRVEQMVEEGILEEAKNLLQKKLSLTAKMALGIRQMQSVLEKERSLEEAKELLKKDTRNYAKRQISWFRHEKAVEFVPVGVSDSASDIAENILARWKKK